MVKNSKLSPVLLEEEVRNLKRTAGLLLEVNLGATAIGTGLNTPQGYTELVVKHLAEVTGLSLCTSRKLN
ncbi:aspartate ammonia-lyase [Haemophilus influenzae]|uniref:Aspartate ammonia-lyase n=1 Tax=Haemophilus influenzae TaxID=727 RepID=A0A2X1PWS0_HAEIF|nr:aspartate ammonia-lyase [Haemophilus influenzae]